MSFWRRENKGYVSYARLQSLINEFLEKGKQRVHIVCKATITRTLKNKGTQAVV
jgi:hypothetical protein